MKDYQEAAFSNWDSRKETMSVIFKRILSCCDNLDPNDAVSLTNPISEDMLITLSELENHLRKQQTENLLNNLFKAA